MTVKLDNGSYKCNICGKVFERWKESKNHEKLCGIRKLDNCKDVDWIHQIEKPETKENKTRQLQLNESFIGHCTSCGNVVTESNKIKGLHQRDAFECSRCEKVLIND